MPKRQQDSDMGNPDEFAAWAFAAGIPDPRFKSLTFQTLIPAPCFPAISRMLWDFGFRHHEDLQTKWVPEYSAADRNLVALGVTSERPSPDEVTPENVMDLAAEMLVDQFPDIAAKVSQVTAENRDEMVREQAAALMASMQRLREATGLADEAFGGSE